MSLGIESTKEELLELFHDLGPPYFAGCPYPDQVAIGKQINVAGQPFVVKRIVSEEEVKATYVPKAKARGDYEVDYTRRYPVYVELVTD